MKNIKKISYLLSLLVLMAAMATVAFASDDFALDTDYLTVKYNSPEEKLATMGVIDEETGERVPNYKNGEYEIWAHEETGEVGIKVVKTGQIILSNPYDIADSTANDAVKQRLLSQIVLQYKDGTGSVVEFNSYANAALNGKVVNGKSINQIKIFNTKNGIRVEYTLGKEQAKYVVPKQIEQSSFIENIIEPWENKNSRDYQRFLAYYDLKDPNDKTLADSIITTMKRQFPATEKGFAIYVLDPGVTNRELEMLSGFIENNTEYDADQMADDYDLIDYIDTSAAPAIFRFAIEYSIDEHGVEVSLPANSISYDSSSYTLTSVKLLPFLGAGNNKKVEGFTFLPDGSGTITRFEDIADKQFTLTGKLYGRDYAYHKVTGNTQETMRLPVIGVMQTAPAASNGEELAEDEEVQLIEQGYVAYYTEGDSLLELSSDHGGTVHEYSSAYASFFPKATDTYSLTGISESGDAEWSVTSDRRYDGRYSMRIFPIYGEGSDYVDMAAAVRDYLVDTKVLTKLDAKKDDSKDTSLYLENFGTIETDDKFLGFPVKVQTSLTTFEQTENIIKELNKKGVKNINVKLTGWYNGGMIHTAPATLDVESNLGDIEGLQALAKFAKANGVGLYPDLDYTYVDKFEMFDGIDTKDDTVKTIDGRKAVHRIYNALYQGFEPDEKGILSAGAVSRLYDEISEDFESIGSGGVSVASVGYDLNSDFNEEYVISRDDAEELLEEFLAKLKKRNGSVMVDGGNSYSLKYADHILGVPLDSSMNINTSESIPFMGMVLHGYTEFAGTPINLDGDYQYSFLKAIENGANLYYLVSKENTSELKSFPEFSKYYAISYDNWKQDIFDSYNTFNNAMKDVKYTEITEHETIGTRLVRVKYGEDVEFILNYNVHGVDYELPEGYSANDAKDGKVTIGEMGFVKFEKGVLVNE